MVEKKKAGAPKNKDRNITDKAAAVLAQHAKMDGSGEFELP
jgi:hypothetical protein